MKKIQWNKEGRLAHECKDHPNVRSTSYSEVSNLIGTNGCSLNAPWWDWSAMGIIEDERGKTLVYPGDWVIEVYDEIFLVIDDTTFQKSALKYIS
jgi:hypothetical protein